MVLDEWATHWRIDPAALADLKWRMGLIYFPPIPGSNAPEGSESRQQSLVRVDAAQHGVWLTRNNVGALLDARGVPVRYGLANESSTQNESVKSADLIGIKCVTITPAHVGRVIGQFVSREVKHAAWHYTGDKHERAQLNWCNFVLSKGGDAAFVTGPGSFNQE